MARAAIALALAALLAASPVAGCSAARQPAPARQAQRSPASPQPDQGPSVQPPENRGRASGCSAAPRLKAGRHTMTHDGLRRTFLLAVPKGKGPHPVLLDLHGLGSDAAQESFYSRLAVEGPRRGYVVATPQAADGRMGWTLPGTPGPDDATGALRALADLVVLPPVERAADDWARAFGCSGRATTRPATGVRLRTWGSCPAGAAVRLYTLHGGGHTWPGSAEVPRLGATARTLDATALILDAFDRTPAR